MTASETIKYTMYLVSVYLIIDSSEKLYSYKTFINDEVFSWNRLRNHSFFSTKKKHIRFLLDIIFKDTSWFLWLLLRALLGISLLFIKIDGLATSFCLAILFVIGSLMNLRNKPLGTETDNRLALMIIGVLFLRSLIPSPLVTTSSIWLIAIQSCVTYLTAGIFKLFKAHWRDGTEILNIASIPDLTPQKGVKAFLMKKKTFAKYLGWSAIALECSFPAVLFITAPWVYLFLIWGVSFHFINAVIFRFNRFFWIWLATYPSIIFLSK